MKFLPTLMFLPIVIANSAVAQPKVKPCFISLNGNFIEIDIPKKYKGNYYSGIPRVINDSLSIIQPNAIDRVFINKDTLFSWPKRFPANSSFNQLFKKIYIGKKLEVLLTVLDEFGEFYLIKKSNESQFRLLISTARMINPKTIDETERKAPTGASPFPSNDPVLSRYSVATVLKKYKGLDVLSFPREEEYNKFLADYFQDCLLLSNKFRNTFYTSNDLLVAFDEYDRCK
jgi:hypothetical protein